MRGTLHFVLAANVYRMLQLFDPTSIYRHLRSLSAIGIGCSRHLLTDAVEENHILSRPELSAILKQGGVSTVGQRGIHILGHLSQKQVLCFGPYQGKQPIIAKVAIS